MDDEQEEDDAIGVSWEQVKALLPDKIELVYVDYHDSLDEHLDKIEEAINDQTEEVLWELTDDWYLDARYDGIDYHIKEELIPRIASEFDIEDDDMIDDIIEKNRDDITYTLQERDTSYPLQDLLHNTTDPIMYYPTGYDSPYYLEDDEVDIVMADIKTALGITGSQHDKDLWLMLQQADHGELVIFFRAGDWDQLLDIGDNNIIEFKDPMVALIDTSSGSGDHTQLKGHTITLPLEADKIRIDCKTKTRYSYTHDVCGMVTDWCECTKATVKKIDYLEIMHGIQMEYRAKHNICVEGSV
jgi:hypothetical protein